MGNNFVTTQNAITRFSSDLQYQISSTYSIIKKDKKREKGKAISKLEYRIGNRVLVH